MKFAHLVGAATPALAATTITTAAEIAAGLTHWPTDAAQTLAAMIAANADAGHYAVFDMDNTSWQFDISEALLPYLENARILTRDTIDPSLKLIPFRDTPTYNETLYSYYTRLCDMNKLICYPWSSQVWAGLRLLDLKGHVDALMSLNGTVPTTVWDKDQVVRVDINPPRVFEGQKELYKALQDNGIDVYPVTASHEEIVRMVVSDPQYGLSVPPENVLGVNTMLHNVSGAGDLTNTRIQIAEGTYNVESSMHDLVMGSYLYTPTTWYAGKWAAVLTYIDLWRKPILAFGDTPGSDTFMHFNVDVAKGGLRLWVNRGKEKMQELQTLIAGAAEGQKKAGQEVTADKNWIFVSPKDLGGTPVDKELR